MTMSRWLRASAYAVSAAGFALSALLAIVVWAGVEGDRVPIHWNGSFEPDGYGSKLLGAALPVVLVAGAIAAFAALAGLTRPRHTAASLFVSWIAIIAFVTVMNVLTVGQTAAKTDTAGSSWFPEALVATALAGALLGGVAGYAVAGRTPPAPRRRLLPPPEPPYWFKAKRYGYGWGRPLTWQGWTVLLGYLVAVLGSTTTGDSVLTLVTVAIGTPFLLWACVRHGEPTTWRWGDRDPS